LQSLLTGYVFVPALKKTAGVETVRSLFTLFCCFYATFVITARAWMACVVIMLTSRRNESAAVHSLRVKVLDSRMPHVGTEYRNSCEIKRFICVCRFCMTSRV